MRRITGLSALAGVLFLTAWAATPARPQAADAKFARTEAMVPTRDGVALFTTVHAPKDPPGPLPIIPVRTPYGVAGRGERNPRGARKDLADDGHIFPLPYT